MTKFRASKTADVAAIRSLLPDLPASIDIQGIVARYREIGVGKPAADQRCFSSQLPKRKQVDYLEENPTEYFDNLPSFFQEWLLDEALRTAPEKPVNQLGQVIKDILFPPSSVGYSRR